MPQTFLISDEYGVPVKAQGEVINALKRQGFTWIVLPRHFFVTNCPLTNCEKCGIINISDVPEGMLLHATRARPPRVIPPNTTDSLSGMWALVAIRMSKCIEGARYVGF